MSNNNVKSDSISFASTYTLHTLTNITLYGIEV